MTLSRTQLENFFVSLTLQIWGLDPTTNPSRVRVGWPTSGSPGWKIDEDVAFIMLTYEDDPITNQVEKTYTEQDQDNAYEISNNIDVLRVNWVLYGPNSFDDARSLRFGLLNSITKDSLEQNNLALILQLPMPQRSPELFDGQWWERTSFAARFNEHVEHQTSVPYIQTGNVQIKKG